MKKIGIILRDYKSASNNDLLALRSDLIEYLRNFQVQIICIPIVFENNLDEELEMTIKIINECDGIILPGGSIIYDIDCEIVKYLYDNNIPTLGICLGMQLMSLTLGGDIGHIGNNNHQSKKEYVHNIKIKENSKLFNILANKNILVNSRHNDYVTTTDLSISAISDDLIIEAVEDTSKSFFIGVQWHPESLKDDIYSKRLFLEFINALK